MKIISGEEMRIYCEVIRYDFDVDAIRKEAERIADDLIDDDGDIIFFAEHQAAIDELIEKFGL